MKEKKKEIKSKSQVLDEYDQENFQEIMNSHKVTGYVYFIQDGKDGNIKIGYSGEPEKRIGDLQSSSGNVLYPLLILKGSKNLESIFHEKFEEHKVHGEWFKPENSIMIFINSEKIKSESYKINLIPYLHSRIHSLEEEVKKLEKDLPKYFVLYEDYIEHVDLLDLTIRKKHEMICGLQEENNLKEWNSEKVQEGIESYRKYREDSRLQEEKERNDKREEKIKQDELRRLEELNEMDDEQLKGHHHITEKLKKDIQERKEKLED